MPSPLADLTTQIRVALLVIVLVQVAAVGRSIVLLRRWITNPSRRPRTRTRKIIRLGVPVVLSLVWAYACVAVLPNILMIPFEALPFLDFGVLALASLTIAVLWGVIIKPILGIRALQRSSGPTAQQVASEPKVPIAAGVG